MGMNLERQHVLTKKEKAVMRVIYQGAENQNGACLLTPIDIFSQVPLDIDLDESELDVILRNLEIDDYFEITRSDRHNELVYCINMHKKGLQFARVERAFKSNIMFKVLFTIGMALVSAAVSIGLKTLITTLMNKG